MKKFIFILLSVCIWGNIYSQTITIKDKETGAPVHPATLISDQPRAFAITNTRGQTEITEFKNATKITVSMLGYKSEVYSYHDLEQMKGEIYLERTNLNLDEVVVTASRWRQTTENVPSKIISIPSRVVSLENPQTAADLLGISGYVFIQKSQQGGGSPMIRGFATNRLLYTVDGIRMNSAIFRSGNLQNVINLDPFAVENTEVLFGPGSVIYGSDAIGGVMGFHTITPRFSLSDQPLVSGKAVSRYSTANNEKTAHFDVNVGWKKWALVTSITSWDFGNLKQGSHGPADYIKPYYVQRQDSMDVVIYQDDSLLQIPSAYSQINMMQKVRFAPSENWDFEYGFHYSETSSYGRYDRHNRMRHGLPRYGEWSYGPQKWMMNNLNITHSGENVIYDRLVLRMAQQNFQESRISRNFNDPEREIRNEDVEAYSINLDFLKTTGENNTMFYGFEYVLNDVTSTGINENIQTRTQQEGPSRYPQSDWSSVAVYISDEYRLSERMTLQAGLRYNQYMLNATFDTTFYPFPFATADLNNGALTGSAGISWRPANSWIIKGGFGTAFRSPNVDDVGKIFDSEPGSVVVPNPDLEAEYAYNFDLDVGKVFDDFAKIDISAWYTTLNNAMVRRDYRLNGMDSIMYDGVMSKVQAIQNAAVAHVYGVQLGLELKMGYGFGFSADMSYQKGEEELDDGSTSPSRHAAPFFGVARLEYNTGKLDMEFYLDYQAEKNHDKLPVEEQDKTEIYALDDQGNTFAPAWYTLNFKTLYVLTDHLSVSAGLENITDQRYRPYSSGISGAGRNFFISLKAGF